MRLVQLIGTSFLRIIFNIIENDLKLVRTLLINSTWLKFKLYSITYLSSTHLLLKPVRNSYNCVAWLYRIAWLILRCILKSLCIRGVFQWPVCPSYPNSNLEPNILKPVSKSFSNCDPNNCKPGPKIFVLNLKQVILLLFWKFQTIWKRKINLLAHIL